MNGRAGGVLTHPRAPRKLAFMGSRNRMRRTLGWFAVCGYTLVVSGLPLPIGLVAPGAADPVAARRLAGKDRSRPFPCMDKPCGCATAEQCFADCCCHTPVERLAWARAHAVEAAVVEALQRRVAAQPRPVGGGSCCTATAQPSCCEAATQPACCATQVEPPAEPVSPESPEPARPRTVSLRAMLACGGIVAQWCGTAAAPPPPRVEPVVVEPPRESLALDDDAAAPLADPPAAPPPRAV